MHYVSSSKTLSFKGASSKPSSKQSKDIKQTPNRKRDQKSIALKRGSGDNKQNICNNIQLGRLVTREFDSNSPGKEPTVKKDSLFGFKINKNNKKEDCNKTVTEQLAATVDLKAFNGLNRAKNSIDSQSIRLKIHLKDSVETKSSFDSKRKQSIPLLTRHTEDWMCANHPDKKAKYETVLESEAVYCCSKCAISLAAKGHKVNHILPEKQNGTRADVLESFLDKIEQLTPKMRDLISTFQGLRLTVSSTYEREFDTHDQYYDMLIGKLVSMKRQGEHVLKECRDKVLNQLNLLETAVKEHLDDTLFMQQDVIPNINSIMSSSMSKVNEERFNSIMGIYNQSLASFEMRVAELSLYKPNMWVLERNITEKLQSCVESIPYLKLQIKESEGLETGIVESDHKHHQSQEQQPLTANSLPVSGSILRPHVENYMYFSFQGPLNQIKSAEKRSSKSKSQPKSSNKKQINETNGVLLKQLANSNARKPFVSLFSEEPLEDGSNSPSFKAM